jgi:hypothetical protein
MGTRSLTHIHDGDMDAPVIVTIYRQMDGYPEGMGADLRAIVDKMKVINGIGSGARAGTHANGMGCAAAQIVGALKREIGNIYLYPPNTKNVWEEFTYHVCKQGDRVVVCGFDSKGKRVDIPKG